MIVCSAPSLPAQSALMYNIYYLDFLSPKDICCWPPPAPDPDSPSRMFHLRHQTVMLQSQH
eukprot:13843724-Ditylum_brightwellii.AAC.1